MIQPHIQRPGRLLGLMLKSAGALLGVCGAAQAIPAFPGAEGFGANTVGGRGGQVYHVTNLNDSGPGSLRDAVSGSNRIVVFDVGGIISLKSTLSFGKNLTVAGQTAPGEGITIYGGLNEHGNEDYGGGRVSFTDASRSIYRGLRIRHGVYASSRQTDAVTIARGSDMIFDHLVVTWGTDETFSISGSESSPVANITIQNSIIGQGLEPHSAGGLIQSAGGGGISLLRNLYIDNNTRNVKANGTNQFVNNVVYNWGATGGDGYILGASSATTLANIQGNYFINGPHTSSSKRPFVRGNENFRVFAENNYHDRDKNGALNGTLLEQANYGPVTWLTTPHDFPAVTVMTPEEAYAHIVANAGTHVRDGADRYMIEELTSLGTKGVNIRHEYDEPMKDRFLIPSVSRPADWDTDRDGMPDEWERTYGLNPTNPADYKGDFDGTGYINVEKYINSIFDGSYPLAPLPTPWARTDIGAVGMAGTAGFNNDTFRNNGGGADIAGTADAFQFIHQSLPGDGFIVVRVTGLQNTHAAAKAGVMIRENLNADAKHAFALLTPGPTVEFGRRQTSGGDTSFTANGTDKTPLWLRLSRSRSTFTAEKSSDGENWTLVGSDTVEMETQALVGLAVTSHNNAVLSSVTFDNVTVTDLSDIPPGTPLGQNDAYTTEQNTALTVAAPGVMANDSDPEGQALTVAVKTAPSHGKLTLNADGSFTYIPDNGYLGEDTFFYTLSDGTLATEVKATITVIPPVNDAPVAVADSYTTLENATLTVAAPGVLANDSDADGDTLNVTLETTPVNGTLELKADGSFVYTPKANFSGTDAFTYIVSDGTLSATTTVSLAVTLQNDAPVLDLNGFDRPRQQISLYAGKPMLVAPRADILDSDLNQVMILATASLEGAVDTGQEGLRLSAASAEMTNLEGLTITSNADNTLLSIYGNAHPAIYRDLLRYVEYYNNAATVTRGKRRVVFTLRDASGDPATQDAQPRLAIISIGNRAPYVLKLTHGDGSLRNASPVGQTHTLVSTFRDPDGALDIDHVMVRLQDTENPKNFLRLKYIVATNTLWLAETDDTFLGGFVPGSANTIHTPLGRLNCAQTSVTLSGRDLTINWSLTPNSGFAGFKSMSARATDLVTTPGLLPNGTWRITTSPSRILDALGTRSNPQF